MMYHEANIRLIDAHPERNLSDYEQKKRHQRESKETNGCHDNAALIRLPLHLYPLLVFRIEASMIMFSFQAFHS